MKQRVRCLSQQRVSLTGEDRLLLENLYATRDLEFQRSLEALLNRAGLSFTLFDDGTRPGAFDYLLHVGERPDLVIECKTKQNNGLVDLNSARVVLASASQYGFDENFCITVCQPGIDPNVPEHLQGCAKLAVVETHDLAAGLVKVIAGVMTPAQLHDWLSQPGQATVETMG
ncbi:hypothetical protein [Methylocystis echinoides]|uniref:hypothetical protein n=1 Tax=Methylocystis echinoides TaxID=29468 RepID=UPI00342B3956